MLEVFFCNAPGIFSWVAEQDCTLKGISVVRTVAAGILSAMVSGDPTADNSTIQSLSAFTQLNNIWAITDGPFVATDALLRKGELVYFSTDNSGFVQLFIEPLS